MCSDPDRCYCDESGLAPICRACGEELDSPDDRRRGGCIYCVRCACGETIADCAIFGDCPGKAA